MCCLTLECVSLILKIDTSLNNVYALCSTNSRSLGQEYERRNLLCNSPQEHSLNMIKRGCFLLLISHTVMLLFFNEESFRFQKMLLLGGWFHHKAERALAKSKQTRALCHSTAISAPSFMWKFYEWEEERQLNPLLIVKTTVIKRVRNKDLILILLICYFRRRYCSV